LAEDAKFTAEECANILNDVDIFKTCGCSPDPVNVARTKESSDKKNEKTDDDLEEEGIPLEDMSSKVACSICGEGYMVTNPDAKGIVPDDKSMTCGDVQEKAEDAKFNVDECADLMNKCGHLQSLWMRSRIPTGLLPTQTIKRMTRVPRIPKKGDDEPHDKGARFPDMSSKVPCSICGDGYAVTMPDATGIDPDDEKVTCGLVQELAEDAKFTAEECANILNDVDIFKTCGCVPDPVNVARNKESSDKKNEKTDDDLEDEGIPILRHVFQRCLLDLW
jgi:predicted nucleic acid-binding Zn ribbon protein